MLQNSADITTQFFGNLDRKKPSPYRRRLNIDDESRSNFLTPSTGLGCRAKPALSLVEVSNHYFQLSLDYALLYHGIRDLDEAGNVSATDIVNEGVILSAVFDTVLVDGVHNASKLVVHLFA